MAKDNDKFHFEAQNRTRSQLAESSQDIGVNASANATIVRAGSVLRYRRIT